ncbi:hypothetical protein BC792_102121 [Sphingobacterium allocomposti]|jgi:hypothetical protein|uniref:Uncharacterized protein n=2 Tax=Sphingobacterium allocomposti TaxID=415956 RepID=A0A5S5DSR5_9SPHI|nr:hypothetical protein BC792_102121 [Sphingobacterium composti Yoo et al. 2007 non Ten et al. 2007]
MLLVALTLHSFYRSIMTLEYQIHLPDYIAKCINKDKPQLHCDGQCVLMKKIKEKEKEETKKSLAAYEYSAHYIHKEKTFFTSSLPHMDIMKEPLSPYLADYRFNYHTAIFRPPIV